MRGIISDYTPRLRKLLQHRHAASCEISVINGYSSWDLCSKAWLFFIPTQTANMPDCEKVEQSARASVLRNRSTTKKSGQPLPSREGFGRPGGDIRK